MTLYPGNVVKMNWQADRVNILFGRIVDQHGEAIPNGLLKGVSGLSTTDEYGLFQAEVMENVSRIDFETQTGSCHIELPKYTALQGVASIGVLTCHLQKKDVE